MSLKKTSKPHRIISGKIIYRSHKAERLNQERGREIFTLTQQSDGIGVLHAHCEIDDAPDVVRDITCAFDYNTLRPFDGTVRLSVGGAYEGTGWFQFTDKQCNLEVHNIKTGRQSLSKTYDRAAPWFGNHAIINDGLLSKLFALDDPPGKKPIQNAIMSSPDHRGATGPELFPLSFAINYIKSEIITVGAGKFKARKFSITDTAQGLPEEHPPYEFWCTDDIDGLFLKGGVGGYMQTYYELVELRR